MGSNESLDQILLWAIAFVLIVYLLTYKKPTGETDRNNAQAYMYPIRLTISESSAILRQFIFDNFDVPLNWIINTYTRTPTYPRNFDELRGSKLFLFFSSLDISEDHILLIKYVNERIQRERRDLYKTVWIPIAENLNWEAHRVDNYLLGIARRLSCYTARPHPACIRNIKDTYRLHNRNNYLVLVEMDQRGHANEYDPDTTIVRERMARFGFRN
ncbi:hypothetical protein PRUPE_1G029200 [Prunus persica]|uniref:Uncharacterized protein n=1 Tax=Prunus persica TaxID=3760 RepID=A0A251QRS2_PRUPE|nr:uncharacterized protein LOC109946657 [Prunus persica]ONI26504.1 hypothetical protein PRUPE_1G029200 [Prunus persica]